MDPQQPPAISTAATFSRGGFWRGFAHGVPLFGSGFVYGIAFGTLAASAGLTLLESVLMSVLVFSGTAQIAVVQVWQSHPVPLAAAGIVLIANVRYFLMSASLRPWLGGLARWKAFLALAFMVDSAYAMAMRARADGDNDAGMLAGPGAASFLGWVIATGLGFLSGRAITDPRALGLDFVVVAFCVSAAVMMSRTTRDFRAAIAAALVVVLCERFMPGPWTIIAAGLTAVVAGMALYRTPSTIEPERTTV